MTAQTDPVTALIDIESVKESNDHGGKHSEGVLSRILINLWTLLFLY